MHHFFTTPEQARNLYAEADGTFGNSAPRRARRTSVSPGSLDAVATEPAPLQETHRILDRDAVFSQSRGHWNIERIMTERAWTSLYAEDWFHTVLNSPTRRIFLMLVVIFTVLVFSFAVVYRLIAVTSNCESDIDNFVRAAYFSVETMTTIGYGTYDYYFGECWPMLIVIMAQLLCSILFDSLCIGLMFARLSRGAKRANTIVFSEKAAFRRHNGKTYFLFQVCELRKHQLVEAHVRCYCIRHNRDIVGVGGNGGQVRCHTTHFQSFTMRLQHPDDELGGLLLLSLPCVVTHRVDMWSPLMPPTIWVSKTGLVDTSDLPFGTSARDAATWKKAKRKEPTDEDTHREEVTSNLLDADLVPVMKDHRTPDKAETKRLSILELGKSLRFGSSRTLGDDSSRGSLTDDGRPVAMRQDYRFPQLQRRAADDDQDDQEDNLIDYTTASLSAKRRELAWPGSTMKMTEAYRASSVQSVGSIDSDMSEPGFLSKEDGHVNSCDNGMVSPVLTRRPSETSKSIMDLEKEALQEYLEDRDVEIVVLVEGIDPLTSCTLQARHSYRWNEIEFDKIFAECVHRNKDGHCVVDFTTFHTLIPMPPCNDSFGPVASYL